MTTAVTGHCHGITAFLLQRASVCRGVPRPFWAVISCDVMRLNVTSGQIQRYVLLPAVIPTCENTHTGDTVRARTGLIACPEKYIFAICSSDRRQCVEFFTLTSHPKTPYRTAAEAGRHVSRNIHNTGNFAASREKNKTDNGGCAEQAQTSHRPEIRWIPLILHLVLFGIKTHIWPSDWFMVSEEDSVWYNIVTWNRGLNEHNHTHHEWMHIHCSSNKSQ